MSVVRYAAAVSEPWRNGGGTTRTLHAGESWRLSVATIERAGPFSAFPGVQRTLVCAVGRVRLEVQGTEHHLLPGQLVRFDGGASTSAVPCGGPAVVVNVMAEVEGCLATVAVRPLHGPSPEASALVLLAGAAEADGRALAPQDALVPAPAGALRLHRALAVTVDVAPVVPPPVRPPRTPPQERRP